MSRPAHPPKAAERASASARAARPRRSEPGEPPLEPPPRRPTGSRPGPVGGKRQENRQKRTQELGQAALRLFLSSGVEVVTIDDIVTAAGVAKGSFYRYFADKEALVETLFAELRAAIELAFARAREALAEDRHGEAVPSAYPALAMELGALLATHPGLVLLYLQEARCPPVGARRPIRALADRLKSGALELTLVARAQGHLRDDVPPEVSALAVVGAIERLLFEELSQAALGESRPGGLGDPAEVSAALIAIFMSGLRRERGP